MLYQYPELMRELLLKEGWELEQLAQLAHLRERQEESDLEQTIESGRLHFARWLRETGRLTDGEPERWPW